MTLICNVEKLSGPKRSIKITDHFTCTSANVIHCITCTLCKKLYIGETSRRLGDRFREHLRDVEKDDKNASKLVARHFNLPNHSMQHMAVCGLSLHQGSTESRKTLSLLRSRSGRSHVTLPVPTRLLQTDIHSFLGNKPINVWLSFSCECSRL